MEKQEQKVDYASIRQQALQQFRSGKSLTGKGGGFAPLFKQFLEAALGQNFTAISKRMTVGGC